MGSVVGGVSGETDEGGAGVEEVEEEASRIPRGEDACGGMRMYDGKRYSYTRLSHDLSLTRWYLSATRSVSEGFGRREGLV